MRASRRRGQRHVDRSSIPTRTSFWIETEDRARTFGRMLRKLIRMSSEGWLQHDRIRQHTPEKAQAKLDREERARRAHLAANPHEIGQRLRELDKEWDLERYLMLNASTLAIVGILLGAFVSRWWLVLPVIVLGFLIQHAVQGWCPPLPIFRWFGKRSQAEIDAERMTLKALRGDFEDMTADGDQPRADAAAARRKTVT